MFPEPRKVSAWEYGRSLFETREEAEQAKARHQLDLVTADLAEDISRDLGKAQKDNREILDISASAAEQMLMSLSKGLSPMTLTRLILFLKGDTHALVKSLDK